ncbi:PEP-CTERM sorting domain-containing protein [Poriferisphaera sp. WC338]|uniref:PEP-CTERM sorting domain-containing protein n=1 Tax=Poriferisphaera sp. WC338 TaxID=3425129 RepID=UPI003D816807
MNLSTMTNRFKGVMIVLCAVITLSLTNRTQAAIIWDFGPPASSAVSIQDIINNGGLQVGSFFFDDWSFVATPDSIGIMADDVKVSAFTRGDGGVGLSFFGPWQINDGELNNTNIGFSAANAGGIASAELQTTAANTLGSGSIDIVETIFAVDPLSSNPPIHGTMNNHKKIGSPFNQNFDDLSFSSDNKIYVVKDITVRGGNAHSGPGAAHLSQFTQYFVPEPGMLALSTIGMFVIGMRRKRGA